MGGIDIVVNSGGVRTNGSITDITEDDWDRTLDVNLKGAFIVSRLAIPEMKKRGGGVILHIAARSGMLGQGGTGRLLCFERRHGYAHRSDGDGSRQG